MVQSRIREGVNYPTRHNIEEEDIGHSCNIYEFDDDEIMGTLIFTIGKIKYKFKSKELLYVPIYQVVNDAKNDDNDHDNAVPMLYTIDTQIGVFEFEASIVMEVFDEDENINMSLIGEPLFYKKFYQKEPTNLIDISTPPEWLHQPSKRDDEVISLADKIFETERNKQVFTLSEESEGEATKIIETFKKSRSNNWVQRYFKNSNYEIHAVEDNGDSFFAVIRDAFASIGKVTNVTKLRHLVAEHTTSEHYNYFKNVCNSYELESQKIKRQLDDIVTEIKQVKPSLEKAVNLEEHTKLMEIIRIRKGDFKTLQKKYAEMELHTEVAVGNKSNREAAESMTMFCELIKKSVFPADEFTISLFEHLLKIKIIILKKEAYDSKTLCHVLKCQRHVHECHTIECSRNNKTISSQNPDFYIIMCYTGKSFELVTYKSRHLFSFRELPYHLKQMILMKCLEGNSGSIRFIDDFKKMEREHSNSYTDCEPDKQANSNNPILVFHKKCEYKAKPGFADGESVPVSRIYDFLDLSLNPYWRRKLDDDWEVSILVDGLPFVSVAKYMEYSKYKNQSPDYALTFTENGATTHMVKEIPDVDPDFEERKDMEREIALHAKFVGNKELGRTLKNTKDSLLLYYTPRDRAKKDEILMKIRDKIDSKSGLGTHEETKVKSLG